MNVASAGSSGASEVWSGASAPMSPSQKMSELFGQIDSSGAGAISQGQFNQAFATLNPPPSFQAAGASTVWGQLDPSGSGSVSKPDFVSTMTRLMQQLRGHHPTRGGGRPDLARAANDLAALGQDTTASAASASGGDVTSTGTILDTLA